MAEYQKTAFVLAVALLVSLQAAAIDDLCGYPVGCGGHPIPELHRFKAV